MWPSLGNARLYTWWAALSTAKLAGSAQFCTSIHRTTSLTCHGQNSASSKLAKCCTSIPRTTSIQAIQPPYKAGQRYKCWDRTPHFPSLNPQCLAIWRPKHSVIKIYRAGQSIVSSKVAKWLVMDCDLVRGVRSVGSSPPTQSGAAMGLMNCVWHMKALEPVSPTSSGLISKQLQQ